MCNCNLENEHSQLENMIVSILYCFCDERKKSYNMADNSRSWFPMEIIFNLNLFASKLQMSLQKKKKQEWSKSIYLKGDACISGFFFFREPGNWGKLLEWWKFNPFKKRCFVYFWIILFAHLIRESGNWGKLWEGSKFNLFKGDPLCISWFCFFLLT